MKKFEFSYILKQYEQKRLSDKNKELVDKWFDQLGQNTANANLSEQQKNKIKSKILRNTKNSQVIRPDFRISAIAASLILVMGLSFFVWYSLEKTDLFFPQHLVERSTGKMQKVILGDGTIIWLKGKSTLAYPSRFNGTTRNVELQGEALFEVAKDPSHPFIIHCGELTAKVLGTSFNIKTTEKKVEVSVFTGKVSLQAKNQNLIVMPNEKAVYKNALKSLKKEFTEHEEQLVQIQGTEYNMRFDDTPLSDVFRQIGNKFDIKISYNKQLDKQRVTADFTDQSLENTLDMLSQLFSINYTQSGNQVRITN